MSSSFIALERIGKIKFLEFVESWKMGMMWVRFQLGGKIRSQ